MASDTPRSVREQAAIAALLVLFGLGALLSASVHSGVPDEVAVHIPAGFLFLETGTFAGGLGNPPLGQVLVALPVWLGFGDYALFEAHDLLAPRAVVIAVALFAALVLSIFARSLLGAAGALGALFFLATSPTFSAHASLATLDVPIAAAILLAVVLARRCASSGAWLDYAMLGVALGVACAIKVQGLAAIPLVVVQIALSARAPERADARVRNSAVGLAISLGVAWVVVHGAYGWAGLSAGEWLPAAFLQATKAKFLHGTSGHTSYLLGELSNGGSWLYFPVALLVKLPIPALVCGAIGCAALVRSREQAIWIGLPIGFFFALAMASSVQIGIRHLLPLFPFGFVAAGLGLERVGRRSRTALAIVCALQLAEALWTAPHGLAYFNAFAGGSSNGYRVLLDSNFDWGQHDEQLREYLESRADKGGGEGLEGLAISPDASAPRAGRTIVGASALHGILGPPNAYAWLREHEPVGRIANTWFEYELTESDIADAPTLAAPRQLRMTRELAQHIGAGARSGRVGRDTRAALATADACWAAFDYACALERSRSVLFTAPDNRAAFWLASELTARRRLGALRFEGRELLDGFEKIPPGDSLMSAERLVEVVERLEPLGVREPLVKFHEVLGDLHSARGEWTPAVRNLRLARVLDPESFAARFKLAWLLATSPDVRERDGALALALAKEHGEVTGWRVAADHDLHAAALAELGRFDEAVAAARRAIELAGDSAQRARIEARLRAYSAGRPHRETRQPGSRS